MHSVYSSTVYIKLNEAIAIDESHSQSPYEWLSQKSKENEICFFWKMVFDFQVTYLTILPSERKGNFEILKADQMVFYI